MFRILTIFMVLFWSSFSMGVAQTEKERDEEFRRNLSTMLSKIEESIKILRQQIASNQNAPFLADLYLQLGELLAQKGNTLYYIQMEKENKTTTTTAMTSAFGPVTAAQKEAIGVFNKLIKEFPEFSKKDKVLYLIAVSYKSIGEVPSFIKAANVLMKDYPVTLETQRVRLLLGQHLMDSRMYREAFDMVLPVTKTQFAYERNLGRYRIGLIYISKEKWKEALKAFELVVADDKLTDQENLETVSLKSKGVKSSLKQEALIDSVRAFTNVFKEDPDPIAYYSKICPTEFLFQDVIQKLAFRYIFLKRYQVAVKLLRTLSERIIDPQKIVNIYQEVLLTIPLDRRAEISSEEMRFLLERYNAWVSFYEIPKAVRKDAYAFFEKQIRDLGTRNHENAKSMSDARGKADHLKMAREYYHLYLSFFINTPSGVKIAANLADVYFLEKNYLMAAEYYLRTFSGEFGETSKKRTLVKNAILCAEKKSEYSFYDQLRARGLLIKGVENYLAGSKNKSDVKMLFLVARTRYEQGMYKEALNGLYEVAQRFPRTKFASDACELILDYYNTRGDFNGLVESANRILQIPLSDKAYRAKVTKVRDQALAKRLDDIVKDQENYDAFEQGKSYLNVAMSLEDRALASTALSHALEKSRSEKDIDTFLKTADLLAEQEKDGKKKYEIENSVVREKIRVTRFYASIGDMKKIIRDSKISDAQKVELLDQETGLLLLLRDWEQLGEAMRNSLWAKLPSSTRIRVKQQMLDLLDSPVGFPNSLDMKELSRNLTQKDLLSLFKAQYRMSSGTREDVLNAARSSCSGGAARGRAVCGWIRVPTIDQKLDGLEERLGEASVSVEELEGQIQEVMKVVNEYSGLENSGDGQLDVLLSLRIYRSYGALGNHLKRVAEANPDFKDVLMNKAEESENTSQNYLKKCRAIIKSAALISPINRFCRKGENPSIRNALSWGEVPAADAKGNDPDWEEGKEIQRNIFADRKRPDHLLDMALKYYQKEYFNHAAATASYGILAYPASQKSFEAVLGCSLINMGLLNEAKFHLNQSENFNGLRSKCLGELHSLEARI